MSFSAGGKRHKHPVVKALFFELLQRVESKKVVAVECFTNACSHFFIHSSLPIKVILSKPVSIVESVMPKRAVWRGVAGKSDQVELFNRFTMLVVFTAWRWSKTKGAQTVISKKVSSHVHCVNL